MRVTWLVLWGWVSTCLGVCAGIPGAGASGADRVTLDFFYEPGCASCEEVRNEVWPELARRFTGLYELQEWDIGVTSNYLRLVAFQECSGAGENEPVCVVIDGRDLVAGVVTIKRDLAHRVEQAIARRLESGPPPAPVVPPAAPLLQRRVAAFTLAGVAGAAAVDSINPCAISTLVFFLSLLSVARVGVRRMWLAGGAFLAGCFATYLVIGFGLFQALRELAGFGAMRAVLDSLILAALVVLAGLSFLDARRFHRSGRAADLRLTLPAALQARIHALMRSGLHRRSLVLGGVGAGAGVTLLESVCTGQVYVPALVLMLKSGDSLVRPALYLLLYNVIFVLPLAVALALTCGGLGTPALVDWSRRNVVASKTVTGVFFLAMAALMVALR